MRRSNVEHLYLSQLKRDIAKLIVGNKKTEPLIEALRNQASYISKNVKNKQEYLSQIEKIIRDPNNYNEGNSHIFSRLLNEFHKLEYSVTKDFNKFARPKQYSGIGLEVTVKRDGEGNVTLVPKGEPVKGSFAEKYLQGLKSIELGKISNDKLIDVVNNIRNFNFSDIKEFKGVATTKQSLQKHTSSWDKEVGSIMLRHKGEYQCRSFNAIRRFSPSWALSIKRCYHPYAFLEDPDIFRDIKANNAQQTKLLFQAVQKAKRSSLSEALTETAHDRLTARTLIERFEGLLFKSRWKNKKISGCTKKRIFFSK